MKGKKGDMSVSLPFEMPIEYIIGIAVLILLVVGIYYNKGTISNAIEYVLNLFRFGR
jgi:hypothetical protein